MTDKPKTFDIRNFAQTMREITFFRTRQLGEPNDPQSLWQAQREVTVLRGKLEKAFNSGVQKTKLKQQKPAELWMFGLAAYRLIVLEDDDIAYVSRLSGNKLIGYAKEFSEPIEVQAKPLMDAWIENDRPEEEKHIVEEPYMFEKLMPEDK